jgi:hypothetical protein
VVWDRTAHLPARNLDAVRKDSVKFSVRFLIMWEPDRAIEISQNTIRTYIKTIRAILEQFIPLYLSSTTLNWS